MSEQEREYVVTYRGGSIPRVEKTLSDLARFGTQATPAESGSLLMDSNLQNFEAMERAGVLEGITINLRSDFIGVLHVAGPDEAIAQLKTFVEDNGLGDVVEKKPEIIPPSPPRHPDPAHDEEFPF